MSFLPVISYGKLSDRSQDEIDNLVQACKSSGLLYLDMTALDLSSDLQKIYQTSATYFGQDPKSKRADIIQGSERGFKQYTGSSTFEIPRSVQHDEHWKLPAALKTAETPLSKLSSDCDAACRLILSELSRNIGMAFQENTNDSESVRKAEQTGLKLCYKDSSNNDQQTNGKSHTDSGLLTLLFYDQPTLQVAGPGDGEWSTISPRPQCAVVNVADALQLRSNRRLHSPLHRVIQPAGLCKERLSAVYFLRAEDA